MTLFDVSTFPVLQQLRVRCASVRALFRSCDSPSTSRFSTFWFIGVLIAISSAVVSPSRLSAQQEFVRQSMLVNTFDGSDSRIGRSLAAALRARIARTQSKRELLIVGNDEVLDLVEGSGISLDKAMSASTLRTVARSLRADEMLFGTVNKVANGFVAEGRLVLVRDERLVQPLPRAAGSSVDGVAATLAESVRKSRLQLVPHRRCENSVRDGALPAAIAHARAALAATPDGVIARSCLLTAMVLSGAPAAELLREAELSLATSPNDYHALDAAARAEDALGNRAKSADYWLRVAATDTADLSLQTAVLNALMRGENAARARPLAERLSDLNPDDMTLLKLRWQVLFALREWPSAVEIGSRLYEKDDGSRADSTFVLRLASAMQSAGMKVRALALAAEGTMRFPGDARLYASYAQFVQGEAPVVIARGVERFPKSAELLLLQAQELRKAGKTEAAVAPLQRALALDPTLRQGYLQLAQSHADAGLIDSVFSDVNRALLAGEDSAVISAFALARGNVLYKAANASKQRNDFLQAIRFLAFSDSVRSNAQARFLLGAAALAVSQSAATDAPKTNECTLSKLASQFLPIAREMLTSGAQVAPDAARQYLTYLDSLEPVVTRQLETLCTGG